MSNENEKNRLNISKVKIKVYSNTHSRVLAVKASIGAIQKKNKTKQNLNKACLNCLL